MHRYWDWTLDHRNLANSSIWDSDGGFGGDGDPNGTETVGNGRCVVEGPFAHLRPIRECDTQSPGATDIPRGSDRVLTEISGYNHTYEVHCLSRGFNDNNGAKGLLPNRPFSPEEVASMLGNDSFLHFTAQVEKLLHNELHQAIAGDFLSLTAANGK